MNTNQPRYNMTVPMFTFTDNRPIHKHIVTLDAAQLAEHLAKDAQFMFYWLKGWDPCLAANRSTQML